MITESTLSEQIQSTANVERHLSRLCTDIDYSNKTFNNLIDWPDEKRAKLPSLPKRAGVVTPTTPPLDAPLQDYLKMDFHDSMYIRILLCYLLPFYSNIALLFASVLFEYCFVICFRSIRILLCYLLPFYSNIALLFASVLFEYCFLWAELMKGLR